MLDPEKARRMIIRLLENRRITKKELAKMLNIRYSVIDKICNQPHYRYRGNAGMYLRLIQLYCNTPW